jgi:hypothetical protein
MYVPKCFQTNITKEELIKKMKNKETLKEAAENFWLNDVTNNDRISYVNGFLACAKWQQEQDKKLYSEEDMILYSDYVLMCSAEKTFKLPLQPKEWFEQFKKK